MFMLLLVWLTGFVVGIFFLKAGFVMVAVQASLVYNSIIGRNIAKKYRKIDVVPDWVKTLAEKNVYQRYSIDPLRIVPYPAFYRKGFKFFSGAHCQYAVSYDGTGKYTLYKKLKSGALGSKTESTVEGKIKIRYDKRGIIYRDYND
jgi:hypothetical protein